MNTKVNRRLPYHCTFLNHPDRIAPLLLAGNWLKFVNNAQLIQARQAVLRINCGKRYEEINLREVLLINFLT